MRGLVCEKIKTTVSTPQQCGMDHFSDDVTGPTTDNDARLRKVVLVCF